MKHRLIVFCCLMIAFLWHGPLLAQPAKPGSLFSEEGYPVQVKKARLRNQLEIAYTDRGKGRTTLLLIHGLGSYLPAWNKNVEELQQQYRCVAIDLPGYGQSSKADLDYSMSFYAEVITELIEQLQLNQVIVVGHSMGGQIAIKLALLHPAKVSRLILIAPAGLERFTEEEKQVLTRLTTAQAVKQTSDEQISKNLAVNFYAMPAEAKFMIKDRVAIKKAPDFEFYCQAVQQSVVGMLHEPVAEELSQLKQPVLIIFGEEDALIPNKYLHPSLSLKELLNHAAELLLISKTVIIPKAGHFVQFEQSRQVNEHIINFIEHDKW